MKRISQQIGWSQESKLIYNILKQLDRLGVVWDGCCTTTTTTTSPFVNLSYSPDDCVSACNNTGPYTATFYTTLECSTNLDTGCRLWLDSGHTEDASNGYYSDGTFCYTISDGSGTIDNKSSCQP